MPSQNILILIFVGLSIVFIQHTTGEHFHFVYLIRVFNQCMNNHILVQYSIHFCAVLQLYYRISCLGIILIVKYVDNRKIRFIS